MTGRKRQTARNWPVSWRTSVPRPTGGCSTTKPHCPMNMLSTPTTTPAIRKVRAGSPKLPRPRIHLYRPGTSARRVHGHLRGPLPATPGHRLRRKQLSRWISLSFSSRARMRRAAGLSHSANGYRFSLRPGVEVVEFGKSGHRPLFEEPGKFVAYMRDTVLAGTA